MQEAALYQITSLTDLSEYPTIPSSGSLGFQRDIDQNIEPDVFCPWALALLLVPNQSSISSQCTNQLWRVGFPRNQSREENSEFPSSCQLLWAQYLPAPPAFTTCIFLFLKNLQFLHCFQHFCFSCFSFPSTFLWLSNSVYPSRHVQEYGHEAFWFSKPLNTHTHFKTFCLLASQTLGLHRSGFLELTPFACKPTCWPTNLPWSICKHFKRWSWHVKLR